MKITVNNLDLAQIADSGQCFRWNRAGDGSYDVIAFDRYLNIKQDGNRFTLSCDEQEWKDLWSSYLDIGTDYEGIGRSIELSGDEYLKKAYAYGSGIRILRQELWETLISFIISQNNNIKRIRGSIEAICNKAALPVINAASNVHSGQVDHSDGKASHERQVRYRFPKPSEIDREFFNDKELGLGYRDQYLADMYEYAAANPDFPGRLKALSNEELKSFRGIGAKVANCVCLFGLHHIDAFPIDTHIKQILATYYPGGFDYERYRGYGGIVQQYMFNYKLNDTKVTV